MRKNHRELDTSIEGYAHIGIKLSQEQLSDLACINTMMRTGTFDDVPVHAIILVMKTLGLLPPEIIDNECGNGCDDYANCDLKDSFQRKFGRFLD